MANNVNIFDKYGIKEVANVYFEALDDDLKTGVYKGDIVLFLDTLKVSTIETTAENVAAQGGWGNPRLVQWDYGKEINITLEDALMSLESLRFMLGGAIRRTSDNEGTETIVVHHTEEVETVERNKVVYVPAPKDHITGITMFPVASAAHPVKLINLTKGYRTQLETGTMKAYNVITFKNKAAGIDETDGEKPAAGDKIRIFWDEVITAESTKEDAVEVTISPDTFPGTYKVVGDTLIRSEKTGRDEPFQFIINKAKVQSNVTITLQAEGDPSTFEMTLNVLRDGDEMMKLVRYNVLDSTEGTTGKDKGSVDTAIDELPEPTSGG